MSEKDRDSLNSCHDDHHTIVIIQRVGRLGNQLLLFAHMVALSLATGVRICHPTLGSYANYFVGTAGDLFCRYPKRKSRVSQCSAASRFLVYCFFRVLDRARFLHFCMREQTFEGDYLSVVDMSNPSFIRQVLGSRYTFVSRGWTFHYPRIHLQNFLGELNQFFALLNPYRANVQEVIQRARLHCDILVGIHIRQTDFKTHAGGKYYFDSTDYADVMRQCCSLLAPARVAFLVVSDESHDSSDFPGLDCFFSSGVDVEDMYSLGGCDYLVGSHASSFSLWPAFLNQVPIYRMLDAKKIISMSDFALTNIDWLPST